MKKIFTLLSILALSCEQSSNQTLTPFDYLFVGTYTQKEGHVDGKASGIYVMKFFNQSGKLEINDSITGITNPSYIDFNADNQAFYAVSEVSDPNVQNAGWIYHFPYDPEAKKLGEISRFQSFGAYPCYIEANTEEVMASNYMGGNIVFYPLDSIGKIIDQPVMKQHVGSGPTSRQEAPHAHSIRKSQRNGLYYAADLGTDEILIYEKSESSIILKQKLTLPAGSGPRHLEFHPTLPLIYVINELSGSIVSIDLNQSEISQEISFLAEGSTNASGADIQISPNTKFLYVSNRNEHNEIVVFAVSDSGQLSFIERVKMKGETPRNFSIHPSGNFLLAAGQDSSSIEVYSISQQTGRLTFSSSTAVPTPVCLVFAAGKES